MPDTHTNIHMYATPPPIWRPPEGVDPRHPITLRPTWPPPEGVDHRHLGSCTLWRLRPGTVPSPVESVAASVTHPLHNQGTDLIDNTIDTNYLCSTMHGENRANIRCTVRQDKLTIHNSTHVTTLKSYKNKTRAITGIFLRMYGHPSVQRALL